MSDNVKSLDATKERVGERVQEAKQRLRGVARDVEQKYQRVAEEMRKEAERASTAAREGYSVAAENVRTGYGRVEKDLTRLSEDVNDYVRDNPAKAVLIAAGVGFLLGLVFKSSGRD